MEHYKIIVSESYHKDLKDILYYIAHNLSAPYSAFNLLEDIESTITNLASMPERYGLIADNYLRYKGFRKCRVKNYLIFFKIDAASQTITIHRILHAKQN